MCLSPFFLLIALLIKLESPGPVFYISKRTGQGFKVFNFLKFRSMRVNADQLLDQFKDINQYREESLEEAPAWKVTRSAAPLLIKDDSWIDEESNRMAQMKEEAGTFVKIKNDPRVTKIGRFIRWTSIDELPQLINVLKGDMSLVGNRPLPLYEAEKITSDEWVMRFSAPAGITGLWQVTRRGRENMSEQERKELDIEYASRYSLWMDLKILFKTLPAAIQKVDV